MKRTVLAGEVSAGSAADRLGDGNVAAVGSPPTSVV